MSTRRRIGVSAATTESARRQLMAKVPCWERVWTTPENAPPGSTLRVYKWVKTDKTQQFSDDEDEADEPLAPLPDEPEVPEVEGDEEMDQDELALPGSVQEAASIASFEPTGSAPKEDNEAEDTPFKPPTPKRHPLSISFQPSSEAEPDDVLDESLAVGVGVTVSGVGIGVGMDDDNGGVVDMDVLDMSALDPDGTAFEAAHDLTQMEPPDELMSGVLMDQTDDPFAGALVGS